MALVVQRCDEWRSSCTVHKTVEIAKQYQDDSGHKGMSFAQFTLETDTRYLVIVVVKSPEFKIGVRQCTSDESAVDICFRVVYINMCRAAGREPYVGELDEFIRKIGNCPTAFEGLCNGLLHDLDITVEARIMDLHYGRKTKSAVRSR